MSDVIAAPSVEEAWQVVLDARAAREQAEARIEEWADKIAQAERDAETMKREVGEKVLAGTSPEQAGGAIASVEAAVEAAQRGKAAAQRKHEEAQVALKWAEAAHHRAKLRAEQEVVDQQYAEIQAAIDAVKERDGRLAVTVDLFAPTLGASGLASQAASAENAARRMQRRLDNS